MYVGSRAENKHAQRNPRAADAVFHVTLWTMPNSQEGKRNRDKM